MKKLIFFALYAIVVTASAFTPPQTNVVNPQAWHPIICSIESGGEITSIGNYCRSGGSTCISNVCG